MRSIRSQWLQHWLPPLAWMGVIYFLSAQPDLPQAPGPWLDLVLKKAGHAAAYGVLAWLYLRVLRHHSGKVGSPIALRVASVGLAMAYALSDEYHQTFVPGRNGNLVDVAVDAVGACVAMLLDWRLTGRSALSEPESRQASAVR